MSNLVVAVGAAARCSSPKLRREGKKGSILINVNRHVMGARASCATSPGIGSVVQTADMVDCPARPTTVPLRERRLDSDDDLPMPMISHTRC